MKRYFYKIQNKYKYTSFITKIIIFKKINKKNLYTYIFLNFPILYNEKIKCGLFFVKSVYDIIF